MAGLGGNWLELVAESIHDIRREWPAFTKAQSQLCATILALAFGASLIGGVLGLMMDAIAWFVICMAAVVWNRNLILSEPYDKQGRDLRTLGWSYLVGGFIIALMTVPFLLVVTPVLLLPFTSQGEVDLGRPPMMISLALTIATQLVLASLCLILPSRAVEREMTIKQSLQMTKGHRIDLALALTVVTLPSIAINHLAIGLQESGGFLLLITGLISTACWLMAAWLGMSIITNAYARIMPNKPPTPSLVS